MCFSFSYKTKYAIVKCFVLVNCFKPSEISKEEKLGKLQKTWDCLGKKKQRRVWYCKRRRLVEQHCIVVSLLSAGLVIARFRPHPDYS